MKSHQRLIGVEPRACPADELGEEFSTRGHLIMAIDREHMIMDSGFADTEYYKRSAFQNLPEADDRALGACEK